MTLKAHPSGVLFNHGLAVVVALLSAGRCGLIGLRLCRRLLMLLTSVLLLDRWVFMKDGLMDSCDVWWRAGTKSSALSTWKDSRIGRLRRALFYLVFLCPHKWAIGLSETFWLLSRVIFRLYFIPWAAWLLLFRMCWAQKVIPLVLMTVLDYVTVEQSKSRPVWFATFGTSSSSWGIALGTLSTFLVCWRLMSLTVNSHSTAWCFAAGLVLFWCVFICVKEKIEGFNGANFYLWGLGWGQNLVRFFLSILICIAGCLIREVVIWYAKSHGAGIVGKKKRVLFFCFMGDMDLFGPFFFGPKRGLGEKHWGGRLPGRLKKKKKGPPFIRFQSFDYPL